MSIDIANEAGIGVDEVGLVAVARFALDQLHIHPLAELSVLLVDDRTMTELHERWMGEPGRRTSSRSRWTSCGRPLSAAAGPASRTPAAILACSATWCSARRSRPNRRSRPATP